MRELHPTLTELLVQPLAAIEANADGKGKIGLQANITEAQFRVLKVVVVVAAAGVFLDWIAAPLGVLAASVRVARLDAGEQGYLTQGMGARLGCGQDAGGRLFVGLGAAEEVRRD